jgi:hypothetical protein
MKYLEVPESHRTLHFCIAGKPGQGKSCLMYAMALQDIKQGKNVCVLDPNGDLVEDLINHIPPEREDDVIYLDGLAPIPLDFMSWHDDPAGVSKAILADDLIMLFVRLSQGEWGGRMDSVMTYAVMTALEAHRTFLDIHALLSNEDLRRTITNLPVIRNNHDLNHYWKNEFDRENKEAIRAITSRMTKYLMAPPLKVALGHPEPELKVAKIIERNEVLLVNLNKIGERAGNVYGSLLVAQIQQAIFKRGSIERQHRTPTYLYVDEFHNFGGASFSKILREARKFKLGLTVATQFPTQLGDELKEHLKGCVSSYVLFKMDEDHARVFRSAIRPHKPEMLAALQEFHALYRAADGTVHFGSAITDVDDKVLGYKGINTPRWPARPTDEDLARADRIRKRTIREYACQPRQNPDSDVESNRDDARDKPNPFLQNQGQARKPKRPR